MWMWVRIAKTSSEHNYNSLAISMTLSEPEAFWLIISSIKARIFGEKWGNPLYPFSNSQNVGWGGYCWGMIIE